MKNRSLVIIACIFFSCTFLYSQEKTQSPTSDLSPTAAFWKEAYEKTFFGINGTKTFHIPADLETTVERRIKLMKELGVLWDRSDWWWHIIEPRQGEFDFSTPDNILKYFEERHIQIYPILCYGAAWWKERNAPLNDEEIEQFANYVSKTVERYKGSFKYWSIWNEPNILPFWAPEPNVEQYAKLLKKAYKAAKNADPDCVICAPVVAPVGQWDKKFVGRLLQLGCMDSFDVFDYHYYRNNMPEKEVPDEIADIKAFMRRYGEEK
nr:beta-galactosidase [Candidatus Sumerlaeota bacterium]